MAVIFRCALQEAYSASPGWLGSRVVSVLDSDTEGPVFKSQSRRCRVTVLGKLFTPIVPLFTKQRNSELLGDTSRHATSLTRYVPAPRRLTGRRG